MRNGKKNEKICKEKIMDNIKSVIAGGFYAY